MTADAGQLAGVPLSRRVINLCLEQGFAAAGVCGVEPSRYGAELRAWLAAGKHGSMGWLAERVEVREDPSRLLDGARSVVMVADQYAVRGGDSHATLRAGSGRIARYARGGDYHVVMKRRLHAACDVLRTEQPGAGFRAFVDTAPAPERELAARCGLGWTGKHTLTIHPRLGSYLLLGGFVTTLELPAPPEQGVVSDHCGSCARCVEACPTDAITPYSVDARRCVSYLTIERRGPMDPALRAGVGDWLFGCDICQEVCPHNGPREGEVGVANPAYAGGADSFDLLEVLGCGEAERRAACRGSAMKRAKLEMWRRIAAVVLRNQLDRGERVAGARERLESIARDEGESELVRGAAWGG